MPTAQEGQRINRATEPTALEDAESSKGQGLRAQEEQRLNGASEPTPLEEAESRKGLEPKRDRD